MSGGGNGASAGMPPRRAPELEAELYQVREQLEQTQAQRDEAIAAAKQRGCEIAKLSKRAAQAEQDLDNTRGQLAVARKASEAAGTARGQLVHERAEFQRAAAAQEARIAEVCGERDRARQDLADSLMGMLRVAEALVPLIRRRADD